MVSFKEAITAQRDLSSPDKVQTEMLRKTLKEIRLLMISIRLWTTARRFQSQIIKVKMDQYPIYQAYKMEEKKVRESK